MGINSLGTREKPSGRIPARRFTRLTSILCLWIVLSLAAGAAGCSRSGPAPQRSTPTSNPADTGSNQDAPPSELLEEENAIVTFAGSSYERALYEPLIETFNQQNPSIVVQYVELPEYGPSDQPEQLNYFRLLATTADTSLVWTASPEASQYFRDLQPLMEADPSFEVDDFWPNLLDGCVDPDGRLIGIPLSVGFNLIFYNEAAFKEAELPLPAPGWTWEDFNQAAQALARKDGDTRRYSLAEQGHLYSSVLAPLVGAHLAENDGEVEAEALESSIQWYLDLAEAESIYPMKESETFEAEYQNWEKLFKTENRPVMWIGDLGTNLPGSEWKFSESDPFINSALNVDGVAPFPVAADGSNTQTTPVWMQCAGMSAGTTHPRAAWTWLEFLSRQRLVRDQTQAYELSRAPARQSVAESSGFWETLPDKAEPTVRFALEHSWFGTQYPQAYAAVNEALRKFIAGKGSLAELLDSSFAQMASTPQPTPDSAAVVVATPRPTLSADTTLLKYFMNVYGSDAEKLKAVIETYQQDHPGVAIKLETDFGSSPMGGDILPYLAEQYDCFTWFASFSEESPPGDIINLNSFVQAEGSGFLQDFNPQLVEQFQVQDELYALPAFSQPQIMAYNLDLLKKRGLQPPSQDWTFDEFVSMLSAVASTDTSDRSYGYMTSQWEDLFLNARGIRGFDLTKDPPEANFDSPEILSGLQWLLEMRQSNALFFQTDDNWPETQSLMNAGALAFWSTQAGSEESMFSMPGDKQDYQVGVVPMPILPDTAEPPYWGANYGHYISRQSEKSEACWDWLEFLSTQPAAFNGVPARLSVAESPAWEALVGAEKADAYRAALSRVNTPVNVSASPIGWPFYTFQSEAVTAILKGEDLEENLNEAQQKADAYLACMAPIDPEQLSAEELTKQVYSCARQVDPEGNWPVVE